MNLWSGSVGFRQGKLALSDGAKVTGKGGQAARRVRGGGVV